MTTEIENIDDKSPSPTQIIIVVILVCIPYALFGMNFINSARSDFLYVIGIFFITFISLFLIPLLLIKYYWKQPLSTYGTQFGNKKLGIIILLVSLIAIPGLYIGSTDPALQLTYPIAQVWFRSFDTNPQWVLFIVYEILYGLLYYVPYEFFWRGFVQFGLKDHWGRWKSILFVTIITTILHATKPVSEIISAAAVGILFGYLADKMESWYYIFVVHYFVGILNDTFCGLRILNII